MDVKANQKSSQHFGSKLALHLNAVMTLVKCNFHPVFSTYSQANNFKFHFNFKFISFPCNFFN